jgi:hypothetical protein
MNPIQSRLGTLPQNRAEDLIARAIESVAAFVRRYRAAVALAARAEAGERLGIDDVRRAGLL